MAAPGSRLHGASDNGASAGCASVRGSAAAPVKDPSGAAPIAPARMTPRPSSARRSSNPLPATATMAEDLLLLGRGYMPLHPEIVKRLIPYMERVVAEHGHGPLFRHVRPDKHGRRSTYIARKIDEWMHAGGGRQG